MSGDSLGKIMADARETHRRLMAMPAITPADVIWDGVRVKRPVIGPMNCPFCNHSVTPRETGNESEVACPACERRWLLDPLDE